MSYSRYRPYQSKRRNALNNMSDKQIDSAEILVNVDIDVACGQTLTFINKGINEYDESYGKYYDTGCCAVNIYDVLKKSEYYVNYSNMYDQMKIDSIKVKVTATNWATGTNDQNNTEYITPKSLVICTAWDRSGLSESQFVEQKDENGDELKYPVYYCVIGKDITTYSSAQTKHLGPGNTYGVTRYLYPSTMVEKEQYVSTSDLKDQYVRGNNEGYPYNAYSVSSYMNENGNIVLKRSNYDLYEGNPCNMLESPGLQFKPIFLIDVIAGDEPNYLISTNRRVNLLRPTTFNLEFDIVVKFRGLRYSKIV